MVIMGEIVLPKSTTVKQEIGSEQFIYITSCISLAAK
jgi:hypothetical protein